MFDQFNEIMKLSEQSNNDLIIKFNDSPAEIHAKWLGVSSAHFSTKTIEFTVVKPLNHIWLENEIRNKYPSAECTIYDKGINILEFTLYNITINNKIFNSPNDETILTYSIEGYLRSY